jgi:hypothetical protein
MHYHQWGDTFNSSADSFKINQSSVWIAPYVYRMGIKLVFLVHVLLTYLLNSI